MLTIPRSAEEDIRSKQQSLASASAFLAGARPVTDAYLAHSGSLLGAVDR